MPTYEFHCEECEKNFDLMLKLSEFDTPQICEVCGASMSKVITAPGVVFKGDSWTTKNNRIMGQMREKNKRLKAKENEQKRDGMVPSLAPNVGGERVDSWSEAKKLAKDKGKDTTGYDRYIRKEKSG